MCWFYCGDIYEISRKINALTCSFEIMHLTAALLQFELSWYCKLEHSHDILDLLNFYCFLRRNLVILNENIRARVIFCLPIADYATFL